VISLAWDAIVKIVALTSAISTLLIVIGTWIVLRFTKPLDSYTEEIAKHLARHQNLERLVEETKRLTDAAENIKSSLSHENWDRQTRWTAKRDLYIRIAEALGEYRTLQVRMKAMEGIRSSGGYADAAQQALFDKKREENLRNLDESNTKYLNAIDAAALMVPDEAYTPLREFKPRQIRYRTDNWEGDFEYNILRAQTALYRFQVAARADLGFGPMVWKPEIIE
jgi:hypothetical protein